MKKDNVRRSSGLLGLFFAAVTAFGAGAGLVNHVAAQTHQVAEAAITNPTGTINFGTNAVGISKPSVTGNDSNGRSWTITTAGTTSFTTNTNFYQIGSSNKPATSITFTTTFANSVKIEAFEAKFGGFSGTAGTVSLKVGSTEVGSGNLNGTDDVTVSSTSQASGTTLTVTITGIAKGVKAYYISYKIGVDKTPLALTGDNVTMKIGDADVTPVIKAGGTATTGYAMTSSNTAAVKVVNGKLRAAGKGTSTITVSKAADDAHTYTNGTFTVTVNASDPTSIAINERDVIMGRVDEKQFTATISPATADQDVSWYLDSDDFAINDEIEIDSDGLVTVLTESSGTFDVYAYATGFRSVVDHVTVTVQADDVVVNSLTFTGTAEKTKYLDNEGDFDFTGITAVIGYSDDSAIEKELGELSKLEEIGLTLVEGATTPAALGVGLHNGATWKLGVADTEVTGDLVLNIEVEQFVRTLESITVDASGAKVAYILGETFSSTGVVVTGNYNDDTNETINGATFSGYDMLTIGDQTVTVSYGGKSATYDITVSAKEKTFNTTYSMVTSNSDLQVEDHVVIAASTDSEAEGVTGHSGSDATVNTDKSRWLKFDVTSVGSDTYSLYDSVNEKYVTQNASNKFTISSPSETQMKFDENGYFAYTDANNNTRYLQKNGSYYRCYTSINSNYTQFYVFKCVETDTTVRNLLSIAAIYSHEGNTYYVGDSIVKDDLTVTAFFDTNETVTITDYTIDSAVLAKGNNEITISYTFGGVTKTTTVNVDGIEERTSVVTDVSLSVPENYSKKYYKGTADLEWDFAGINVVVTWSDNTTDIYTLAELVESGEATVSPANPTVGTTSFTVSCKFGNVEINPEHCAVSGITVVNKAISSISWTNRMVDVSNDFYTGDKLALNDLGTVSAKFNDGTDAQVSLSDFTVKMYNPVTEQSKTITFTDGEYALVLEDDGCYVELSIAGVDENDVTKTIVSDHTKYTLVRVCERIDAVLVDSTAPESIDFDLTVFDDKGTSGSGGDISETSGGFTVSSDKGYKKAGNNYVQIYAGGTLTIDGGTKKIIKIKMGLTSDKKGSFAESYGSDEKPLNVTSYSIKNTANGQAQVTSLKITYEGSGKKPISNYEAQYAVTKFARAFYTALDDVCSSPNGSDYTKAKFAEAWSTASAAYSYVTALTGDNLADAKAMLSNAVSNPKGDILQKAMARYENIVSQGLGAGFMTGVTRSGAKPNVGFGAVLGMDNGTAPIVLVGIVSAAAVAGSMFLRKKKEN